MSKTICQKCKRPLLDDHSDEHNEVFCQLYANEIESKDKMYKKIAAFIMTGDDDSKTDKEKLMNGRIMAEATDVQIRKKDYKIVELQAKNTKLNRKFVASFVSAVIMAILLFSD